MDSLRGLNPAQREAAEHVHGPILVVAGAGSGKTRVLTARIAHLIDAHGVPPQRIFAVTFTNKAAGEMKHRVGELLSRDPGGLWIGTFHSLSARLLRREADRLGFSRQFTIYDEDDRLSLIRRIMDERDHPVKLFPPKLIQNLISSAKNRMQTAAELEATGPQDAAVRVAADVYVAMQRALLTANAMDFDDLMLHPLALFRHHPDALERCLESLRHQRYEQFEVIVVDNGCESSATAELVARAARADSRVRYVWESRLGLARAHNRGLNEAHGSIAAFTDDDVVVDEHWLTMIVDAFHEDPAIGCVTGLIAPLELETVSQAWIESSVGFSKGFVLRRFDPRALPVDDPLFPFAAGRFGSGANMSFRTDVLREIGGFDAALGAGSRARGGDDLAAFFDVIVSGHVIVYEPGAIVRHAHRPDFESLRRQSFGYGVGLGAYLAHVASRHPRHAFHGMFRMRHAAAHFLAPGSAKNVRRPADYPKQLQWRERVGVLLGPGSYVRSRFETRRDGWTFEVPRQSYAAVGASPNGASVVTDT